MLNHRRQNDSVSGLCVCTYVRKRMGERTGERICCTEQICRAKVKVTAGFLPARGRGNLNQHCNTGEQAHLQPGCEMKNVCPCNSVNVRSEETCAYNTYNMHVRKHADHRGMGYFQLMSDWRKPLQKNDAIYFYGHFIKVRWSKKVLCVF